MLLLDDLHVDASRSQKAGAARFIEANLAPNDLMAVMTVGGSQSARRSSPATSSLLLAAVDNFMGAKVESATIAQQRVKASPVGGRKPRHPRARQRE